MSAWDVLPARVAGEQTRKIEAAVIVTDNGRDVVVRFRHGRPWLCGDCGSQETAAGCEHAFSAAMTLAEQWLRLKPVAVAP